MSIIHQYGAKKEKKRLDEHHTYVPCLEISSDNMGEPLHEKRKSEKQQSASLWGRRQRYHPPPPSWPAEMSGRSQRKRDNQRYGFSLYKCVSLFSCQQRVRCNRVTFGDNEMLSHPRPVAEPLTGPIIGVSVWEVILYVHMNPCACAVHGHLCVLFVSPLPLMYAYVCVSVSEGMALSVRWYNKWRQ